MRTFLAIDLPDGVKDALEAVQDDLPFGRAVAAESLHLTLAFLDEQPDSILEAAHESLERLEAADFAVEIRGLGTFGRRFPRVLYAGVAEEAPVQGLRRKVLAALREAGLVLPRTRYRPHVTLARFRANMPPGDLEGLQRAIARWIAFRAGPFDARRVILYRSVLHPEGEVYTELARYPLGQSLAALGDGVT